MKKGSPAISKLAKELFKLRKTLSELSKRESEVKSALKAKMGAERLVACGDLCVLIEERYSTSFDRDSLTNDMGLDFVQKYMNKTIYEIVSIKDVSASRPFFGESK